MSLSNGPLNGVESVASAAASPCVLADGVVFIGPDYEPRPHGRVRLLNVCRDNKTLWFFGRVFPHLDNEALWRRLVDDMESSMPETRPPLIGDYCCVYGGSDRGPAIAVTGSGDEGLLFVGVTDEGTVLCPTLSVLLAYLDQRGGVGVDLSCLAYKLATGAVRQPLTPYHRVYALLPGSVYSVTRTGIALMRRCWLFARDRASVPSPVEWFEMMRSAMYASVAARAPAPLFVTFSGGMDSTSLAAIACRLFGPEHVHLLHYDYAVPGSSERHFAESVARELGAPLSVAPVLPEEITNDTSPRLLPEPSPLVRLTQFRTNGHVVRGAGGDQTIGDTVWGLMNAGGLRLLKGALSLAKSDGESVLATWRRHYWEPRHPRGRVSPAVGLTDMALQHAKSAEKWAQAQFIRLRHLEDSPGTRSLLSELQPALASEGLQEATPSAPLMDPRVISAASTIPPDALIEAKQTGSNAPYRALLKKCLGDTLPEMAMNRAGKMASRTFLTEVLRANGRWVRSVGSHLAEVRACSPDGVRRTIEQFEAGNSASVVELHYLVAAEIWLSQAITRGRRLLWGSVAQWRSDVR